MRLLKLRNFVLYFFCFLLFSLFTDSLYGQYATTGTGRLRNQIWWFDWSNFTISNGATKSIVTDDGLNINIVFSNVTNGNQLVPTVMNTWPGAVLHLLYNFTDPAVKPALFRSTDVGGVTMIRFTMAITATRNGTPVPFNFVTADAEASVSTEVTRYTTSGSNWSMIEFFRNSGQTDNPVTGCGTGTVSLTRTYAGAPQTGTSPILSTTAPQNGSLTVTTELNNSVNGGMAVAFGIYAPIDRGDLPASYGFAQHQLGYTSINGCNYNPPYPTTVQDARLKIGNVAGDADNIQSLDDNSDNIDEEGVASFPMYNGSGQYTLQIPVGNSTGANAYLSAWFDYNRDGSFSQNEFTTVTVLNGATTATLIWTGMPANLQGASVNQFGFRFRLSSSQSSVSTPTGTSPDGEVEDYLTNTILSTAVIASFTAPDTVCVNTPVTVTNTSQNATNYYWNFCGINTNAVPVVTNMGNVGGSMLQPVYSEVIEENGNYYLFVSNYTGGTGGLVRLDFGNSLFNNPTPVNYGNLGGVLPFISKGIQVRKNNGNWYVIMIGHALTISQASELSIISLGANITNPTPTAKNWGNVANILNPWDLYVFKENNNWYGYTIGSSNIVRLNFGADFSVSPVATNLGNLGVLNGGTGIGVIKTVDGWHMFVVSHNLVRLDFGNSLLNNPTSVDLGNLGNSFGGTASDISFVRFCDSSIQAIATGAGSNRITRLDFGNNILNTPVPTILPLGITGQPSSVSNVFVSGDKIGVFVTSPMTSILYRLELASGCTDIPSSKLENPAPFVYSQPGTYNINLLVDVGLPTQTAVCKQIVVVSPASLQSSTKNIEICQGDSVKIGASSLTGPYLWNTGEVSDSIHVKTDGTYWVEMSYYGCAYRDSIYLTIDIPPVQASNDTIVCKGNIVQLNASGAQTYSWVPVPGLSATNIANPVAILSKPTEYIVTGTNAKGCTAKDTVLVDIFSDASISLTNDTLICKNTSVQLLAGGGITYSWVSDGTLSSDNISNPVASPVADTKYYVSITDNNNCSYIDSVMVSIKPPPVFSINSPVQVCLNDSVQLTASGGDLYSWQAANGLGNSSIANPKVSPTINTTYTVTITETVCNESATLSTDVTVLPLPDVQATKSNDIDCSNDQAQLNATGGQSYSWSPSSTLSNSNAPNPVARPTANTRFIVKGTDGNGCSNYDSVMVNVDNVNRGGYLMPTAFTPNGDGLNDCYGIRYWGVVQEVDFSIYNRWGERIFYTKDPNKCWDGMYKGVMQGTDVFVYMIRAKTSCDDAVFRKGTFTLIR